MPILGANLITNQMDLYPKTSIMLKIDQEADTEYQYLYPKRQKNLSTMNSAPWMLIRKHALLFWILHDPSCYKRVQGG